MEKSSQIAWKIVPLRHFPPLKVVPLIEVLLYMTILQATGLPGSGGCPIWGLSTVLSFVSGPLNCIWSNLAPRRGPKYILFLPGSGRCQIRGFSIVLCFLFGPLNCIWSLLAPRGEKIYILSIFSHINTTPLHTNLSPRWYVSTPNPSSQPCHFPSCPLTGLSKTFRTRWLVYVIV
jgi:hypothetical protein